MTLQISDFFSDSFSPFITLTRTFCKWIHTLQILCSAFELYAKYIFSSKWDL